MTQKTNFFKLGLFAIVAFGVGTAFLIVFGAGQFFKKELLAETCFNESVQGLSIGSEVKYKGIKIGTVKSITSASRAYQTKSDYVLVILSLEDETCLGQTGESAKIRIHKAVKDGLVIRLSFKGLTGAAYLETDYSAQGPNDGLDISWTPRNIYIPSQRSNMKQFSDAINQILDNLTAINVKGITLNIETLLKTLDQKINAVDMTNISSRTTALLKELNTLVETSKTPLNKAITDFQKTAGSTRKITGELETHLAPKIDALSSNLDQLTKSLAGTAMVLENTAWLNSDKIRLIMDNLETSSENLKQMTKDLKQYPGRLLFEKPPEKINPETNN